MGRGYILGDFFINSSGHPEPNLCVLTRRRQLDGDNKERNDLGSMFWIFVDKNLSILIYVQYC
jgi:hypothetical protein